MPHKRSQEGCFLRSKNAKKKKPTSTGVPSEIYVAIDQLGNIHDTSKHKDFIESQIKFMKKTFKISFRCVKYVRETGEPEHGTAK